MPAIPVQHRFFVDPSTGEVYDISKCKSKWVSPAILRKWYTSAHNSLQMYRLKYNKSGQHDFNTDEGLEDFVVNFAQGNKDACYLAVLANFRGDEALEHFSAELPKDIEIVDGFTLDDNEGETMSVYTKDDGDSVGTKNSRSTTGGETDMDRLIKALAGGASESPSKKELTEARTSLLKQDEANRKRKADMSFSRDLRKECEFLDDKDPVDAQIKRRCKEASQNILGRLLEQVESESPSAASTSASSTSAASTLAAAATTIVSKT